MNVNDNGYELYGHFIFTNEDGSIIRGWSNAIFPDINIEGMICINDNGSYQFRLSPDGEENPRLFTEDMIPLYKWDGEKVVSRTEEEIEADRAEMIANQPAPKPTEMEKLRADLDYVMLMNGLDVDPN